jgi:hypothetical protein
MMKYKTRLKQDDFIVYCIVKGQKYENNKTHGIKVR